MAKIAYQVAEDFARSSKSQMKRRQSPRSIGMRDPSLRWPHLYDILRSKGYSKEKAAKIANSRLRYRKKGRLHGLPYQQADNPGALAKVRAEQERKRSRTASALVASCHARATGTSAQFEASKLVSQLLEFACNSKACAPPPVGSGGSNPGGSGKVSPGGGSSSPKTFKPITSAEARGDSKPVSAEEFQRLATEGQAKLDAMRTAKSPIMDALMSESDRRAMSALRENTWKEVQNEWGGATIDMHDGSVVPQGANRYAMTVKSEGMETVSIPIGSSQGEFDMAFNKAKGKFESVLEYDNHYLGVFRDDDVGRIDFDPVIVVDSLSDVHTIGAATRAIGGAYNFADGNGYWPPHVKDS